LHALPPTALELESIQIFLSYFTVTNSFLLDGICIHNRPEYNINVPEDNVVHITATFGLVTGQTTVASDVTSKYNKLGEPYQQGFILETFKAMPGVGKIGWNANETPYQGTYSRPQGYGNNNRNKIKCNLHVVNYLLFPINNIIRWSSGKPNP